MRRMRECVAGAACLALLGCVTDLNRDVVTVQTFPSFKEYRSVRRVAVIPFAAYKVARSRKVVLGIPHKVTEDNGKIMCDIVTRELKKDAGFTVVDPGRVAAFFSKRGKPVWGLLPPDEIRRVGRMLHVDALIMGRVEDFSIYQYRMYEQSRVAVSVRMADAATGELIWKGRFALDQEGKPHEVAGRGARLLIDQIMSRWGARRKAS